MKVVSEINKLFQKLSFCPCFSLGSNSYLTKLDSNARDWLGEYLSNYEGSIVLVSHDTFLLSTSVNNIAEVCANTLMKYRSFGYDKYLIEKEFRAKSMTAEYERNVAEAARLQAFVDKFGASATKAASAQSRVKMIGK